MKGLTQFFEFLNESTAIKEVTEKNLQLFLMAAAGSCLKRRQSNKMEFTSESE